MQPEIPAVLVEAYVLQARNLPRKSAAGQSDTFCLVEATGSPQKYRTNVVPGTLHPVWNESFQVKVRDPASQMITVKIWAEKKDGNHDFVGVVVVPVSRIESGVQGTEEGWYEIRGERNDVLEGPDGMSKVELSFVHKKASPNEQQVSGFMFKKADAGEEWTKRFAVLDPYCQLLQFFESPKSALEGSPFLGEEVNTRTCTVQIVDEGEISPTERKAGFAFKLETNFHSFIAQINSIEERNTWIEALRRIGNPPGMRILPAPPTREKRTPSLPTPGQPQLPRDELEPKRKDDSPAPTSAAKSVPPADGDGDSAVQKPVVGAVAAAAAAGGVDADGLWQKKFDATRRALADQVAQNQTLQARIAELEDGGGANGAGGEAAELREALGRAEAALAAERRRAQLLEKEVETAKSAGNGGSADHALVEEKRQLQGEAEHLRSALGKAQEKIALLQIQDANADLSKELKKQLEDAHRSLAEVKQKHLRSEQSRMAAEAEAQELRAALESSSSQGNSLSAQQAELMAGLKQQVDVLTKRLEGLDANAVPALASSVPRTRGMSPETTGPVSAPVQNVSSRGRDRNSRARELCADITSTLNSRRQPRTSEYIPGTNLASLSPPPRQPTTDANTANFKNSPRYAVEADDPNLM